MATKKVDNSTIDFEESIKNYGNKIEHIDSFVEAVRRFPGKSYKLARRIRNNTIKPSSNCWDIQNG